VFPNTSFTGGLSTIYGRFQVESDGLKFCKLILQMIDITGPKVLVPTILFALLSPGLLLSLPPGSGLLTQVLFHALVFAILSWVIIHFGFKFTLTLADLIVPVILFILLTPGVILTLPPNGGYLFLSGHTGVVPILVHTLVFSIVWASTRGFFPQFY